MGGLLFAGKELYIEAMQFCSRPKPPLWRSGRCLTVVRKTERSRFAKLFLICASFELYILSGATRQLSLGTRRAFGCCKL